MKRRPLLCTALIAATATTAALANDYPSRPVKVLIGFPAGSGTDVGTRQLAGRLSQALGQAFYVENKPGAAGAMAADAVASAPPDGYTLLASSSGPLVLNPLINRNVKFDLLRDFVPIAITSSGGYILAVNAASRHATLKDLVAAAKASPGKLSYASSGNGVTNHLLMEIFKHEAGIDLVHVPYKGSVNGLNDLAGGQVDAMFDVWPVLDPLVKAGKIRPLAIATDQRDPGLPNVPTVAELGYPGFRGEAWTAILAPARTPPAIVAKLHEEISKIQRSASWQAFVRASGGSSVVTNQQELQGFIKSEMSRWGEVVKRTKVQAE